MPSTSRGPNRSLKRPMAMAKTPIRKKATDVLAESAVRDQPYSASNGLKNNPNEISKPITVNWVREAPNTTRYRMKPLGGWLGLIKGNDFQEKC